MFTAQRVHIVHHNINFSLNRCFLQIKISTKKIVNGAGFIKEPLTFFSHVAFLSACLKQQQILRVIAKSCQQ